MLTYDELAKKKLELIENKKILAKEFEAKNNNIDTDIEKTQELLDNYEKYPPRAADGCQHIWKFDYNSPSTMINLIEFAVEEIKKGSLSDIQKRHEKFIATYNIYFNTTSYYTAPSNQSIEHNTRTDAIIYFSTNFYNLKVVQSEDTVAILAYLKYKKEELEKEKKEGAKG
ncbi:hypothetical protein FOX23_14785 [Listeria monocytogenes]|nr:hypothetical protein [Listeria monocytogenes]